MRTSRADGHGGDGMGLIDRIRKQRATATDDDEFSPMPGFRVEYGDDTRFITDGATFALMREGSAQRTAQEQYYVLDALADEARASVLADGFSVPAEEIALLTDDDAAVLDLPPRFTGKILADVQKWTSSPDFRVDLNLQAGAHPAPPRRRGPAVLVGGTVFRASLPLLRALRAVEDHAALRSDARTEAENVRLVAQLQAAQRLAVTGEPAARDGSFVMSLGALEQFTTVAPSSVGLVVEPQADGSLVVEPDLGPLVDRSLVSKRWHQLGEVISDEPATVHDDGPPSRAGVLRAGTTLVLLGPEQIAGVREVRRRPRIPADQAQQLYDAPGSFYDPSVVDVDIRFSVRVAGLGVIAPVTFRLPGVESSGSATRRRYGNLLRSRPRPRRPPIRTHSSTRSPRRGPVARRSSRSAKSSSTSPIAAECRRRLRRPGVGCQRSTSPSSRPQPRKASAVRLRAPSSPSGCTSVRLLGPPTCCASVQLQLHHACPSTSTRCVGALSRTSVLGSSG